ncbi:MAG TPA: hypothetical protein VHE30_01475 [Polyangiaceae bacterium]|nr:hypothetical protein [Polyangiaceae bacterium]
MTDSNVIATHHDATPPAPKLFFTVPPIFGDGDSDRAYEAERRAAKNAQAVRFAVAPRCRVVSFTRGPLEPGAEVTLADVGHDVSNLDLLRRRRAIIELEPHLLAGRRTDPTARFVVAPKLSTISRTRGLVTEGMPVDASDFAEPEIPPRPATAPFVAESGVSMPGFPGVPGRPGHDGTAALLELVRRGVVVDRHPERDAQEQAPARKGAR